MAVYRLLLFIVDMPDLIAQTKNGSRINIFSKLSIYYGRLMLISVGVTD